MKGPLHCTRAGIMDENSIKYFRERERIEREAASGATCDTARLAHEKLAEGYAALIRNARKSAGGTLSGLWSRDLAPAADFADATRRHGSRPY
jgi:hypothetical protein